MSTNHDTRRSTDAELYMLMQEELEAFLSVLSIKSEELDRFLTTANPGLVEYLAENLTAIKALGYGQEKHSGFFKQLSIQCDELRMRLAEEDKDFKKNISNT